MKTRFLADASFNERIVRGAIHAEPSIDFSTANDLNLEGLPDEEVLTVAAREGRILVTHDLKTMPFYFGRFVMRSRSPGVLLISQKTGMAEAIESILLVWSATEAEEWHNRICRLPL